MVGLTLDEARVVACAAFVKEYLSVEALRLLERLLVVGRMISRDTAADRELACALLANLYMSNGVMYIECDPQGLRDLFFGETKPEAQPEQAYHENLDRLADLCGAAYDLTSPAVALVREILDIGKLPVRFGGLLTANDLTAVAELYDRRLLNRTVEGLTVDWNAIHRAGSALAVNNAFGGGQS